MPNAHLQASYGRPYMGLGYDVLSRGIFGAVGGLDEIRHAALDHLEIGRGTRVLELGCGTGGVSVKLLARGAIVTSVDWSEPMLRRARRRAPSARFIRSEITAYEPCEPFDVVLFSFVLHELGRADRQKALAIAARALPSGVGRVAILDFALPERGLVPRILSAFVHGFEPATTADWLVRMDDELREAGFVPGAHLSLASGLATALSAHRG